VWCREDVQERLHSKEGEILSLGHSVQHCSRFNKNSNNTLLSLSEKAGYQKAFAVREEAVSNFSRSVCVHHSTQ